MHTYKRATEQPSQPSWSEQLGAPIQPAPGTLVLSATKVRDYQTCRRKFFLAHILRVPGDDFDSDSSVLGRYIHRELYLRHELMSEHEASVLIAQDIAVDPAILRAAQSHSTFCPSHDGATYLGGEVDLRWMMRAKNVLLTGRADAVWRYASGEYEVRDYKTGSIGDEATLAEDVAAQFYGLLVVANYPDARRVRVTYEQLGPQPRTITLRTTSEHIRSTIFRLQDLTVAIRKERSFDPTPSVATCGSCAYATTCPASVGPG